MAKLFRKCHFKLFSVKYKEKTLLKQRNLLISLVSEVLAQISFVIEGQKEEN